MKAILHIGMPKTGSSSIQDTLAQAKLGKARYFDWRAANHSSLLAVVCKDTSHGYAKRYSEAELDEMIAETASTFRENAEKEGTETFVISAERLFNSPPGNLRIFKEFLDQFATSYSVIGYVREPSSFLVSAFQQNIKMGKCNLRLNNIWPDYKRRIGHFDQLFGQENVRVRLFDRASLKNGDVVEDFADVAGIDLDPGQIVKTNESLSAEAVALLYLDRQFGQSFEAQEGPKPILTNKLVQKLSTYKGRSFTFSDDLLRPVLEANSDDIRWIEDRLGTSFSAKPKKADIVISNQRDLVDLAMESQDVLHQIIRQTAPSVDTVTPASAARFALGLIESRSNE